MAAHDVNPIIRMDFPDPDVIRVGDVFYMATTTMHFFPGCEILRSWDLVHWEHASFVYDRLDGLPCQRLAGNENNYGHGMWAASLRQHQGRFYVSFIALETHSTYLYTASAMEGPWHRLPMEGFYYDASLLFDQDRVYIVHGQDDIFLTELKPDLSGPLPGGLQRKIVSDHHNPILGYEGSHLYHIGDYYYLFLIHSLRGEWKRVEACFRAPSLDAEFEGRDILCDDRGYCGQGVAQGGLVEDSEHRWWSVLFQDHGAVGRIPVLIPVTWENGWPVLGDHGRIPVEFSTPIPQAPHTLAPLYQSDNFALPTDLSPEEQQRCYGCYGLKSVWQFNHEPTLDLVQCVNNQLRITTGKLCRSVTEAQNTLTQRTCYPCCAAEVHLDASDLQEGDTAGLCALQGCYGFIGLRKQHGQHYLVMEHAVSADASNQPSAADVITEACIPWPSSHVTLRLETEFKQMHDTAAFYYQDGSAWKRLGPPHQLYFKLDHFTGCRFALFIYATAHTGGTAAFSHFRYEVPE